MVWFSQEPMLPGYDFSEAMPLSIMQRFERAVPVLQEWSWAYFAAIGQVPMPTLPGLSEDEIAALEMELEATLAIEYKEFLRHWGQIDCGSGLNLFGAVAWVTDTDFASQPYLVIGDYFRFADGDALMMPLTGDIEEVALYLHECGPKMEQYAPSFSLALWRMAHESF